MNNIAADTLLIDCLHVCIAPITLDRIEKGAKLSHMGGQADPRRGPNHPRSGRTNRTGSRSGSRRRPIEKQTVSLWRWSTLRSLESARCPRWGPKILWRVRADLFRKGKSMQYRNFSEREALFWIKMKSFYRGMRGHRYHHFKQPIDALKFYFSPFFHL